MNCEIEKGDIIQLKPQFLGNLRKKKVRKYKPLNKLQLFLFKIPLIKKLFNKSIIIGVSKEYINKVKEEYWENKMLIFNYMIHDYNNREDI